jgi:hypothetical protein
MVDMTYAEVPPGTTVLETDRLVLRRWLLSDAPMQRQLWLERDPRVPPHRRISPDGQPSVEDLEDWIRKDDPSASLGLLAAVRKDSGELVGYCGLIANSHGQDGLSSCGVARPRDDLAPDAPSSPSGSRRAASSRRQVEGRSDASRHSEDAVASVEGGWEPSEAPFARLELEHCDASNERYVPQREANESRVIHEVHSYDFAGADPIHPEPGPDSYLCFPDVNAEEPRSDDHETKHDQNRREQPQIRRAPRAHDAGKGKQAAEESATHTGTDR